MPQASNSIKTISSLKDFVIAVEARAEVSKPLWFRGVGNSSYKLIPSLYRKKGVSSAQDFLKLECAIIDWFAHRSRIFLMPSYPSNQRELYFILQHHGVPTRLLDWTENPFIALFFALSSALKNETDCALWMLNPEKWNLNFFDGMGLSDNPIPSYNHDILKGFLDETSSRAGIFQPHPLAFYGSHNNQRITAQRGVFVFFGTGLEPMEDVARTKKDSDEILSKIIVKAEHVSKLFDALNSFGYTASVVYPDLEGMAQEICYKFDFQRK